MIKFKNIPKYIDVEDIKDVIALIIKHELNFDTTNFFTKIFTFRTKYKQAVKLYESIQATNVEELIEPYPDIDNISYNVRKVVETRLQNIEQDWAKFVEQAVDIISLIEYEKLYGVFNDDFRFTGLKYKYMNEDWTICLSKFNGIVKAIEESNEKWDALFKKEYIFDQDWESAGGSKLDKFSILSTLTSASSKLNTPFEQTKNIPFKLIQSIMLLSATEANIQNELSNIQERKLKKGYRQ